MKITFGPLEPSLLEQVTSQGYKIKKGHTLKCLQVYGLTAHNLFAASFINERSLQTTHKKIIKLLLNVIEKV